MTAYLHQSPAVLWCHRHRSGIRLHPPFSAPKPPNVRCALTKRVHRFLSSLATATAALAASKDPSVANRLIGKFIASSPKRASLTALSHLLSPQTTLHPRLSSLALPFYIKIRDASWFSWNPKLVADLIALLFVQNRFDDAQALFADAVAKLGSRERDLCSFYCNLVDSHSRHGSKLGVLESIERLNQLVSNSASAYLRKQVSRSMVSGLCSIDLPREGENVMEEGRNLGVAPSVYEYRFLVQAYGTLKMFQDMERIIFKMEMDGLTLDTVTSNMILSSFGAHNELSGIVLWLRRMKESKIPLSIRTYNSVLNSCPTIMSMLEDQKSIPLSVGELMSNLRTEEALLVGELIGSVAVLGEAMEEESGSKLKLDLHGMHMGTAYIVMLRWLSETRALILSRTCMIPTEVTVVCGLGKHSRIRGRSPVKALVKEMVTRLGCPMIVDSKNDGCFVVKGCVFRNWVLSKRC